MKRKILITVSVIVAVAALIFWHACTKDKNETDLDNLSSIQQLSEKRQAILNQLSNIPDSMKIQFLKEQWPSLGKDVVASIRGIYIPADAVVDTPVVLMYGSGAGSADDSIMQKSYGTFNNQLIAVINIHGDPSNPHYFFVRCSNGLFNPHPVRGSEIRTIGSAESLDFTILKDESLCDHVDYKTSIRIARMFHLPVYRGEIKVENRISYDEADRLESETDQILVTVIVQPGDYFDLGSMTSNNYHQ